jgi:hypothetical protein
MVVLCLALACGPVFCSLSGAEITPSRAVLAAQQSGGMFGAAAPRGVVSPAGATSARPKDIDPSTAMYHSLCLAGWGQLDNGRKKKAALFIAAETFFIGGIIYEEHLLNESGGDEFERNVNLTDRNTYIIFLLGAKLFGMVDAYVDAQLKDFDVSDVTPPGLEKYEPR